MEFQETMCTSGMNGAFLKNLHLKYSIYTKYQRQICLVMTNYEATLRAYVEAASLNSLVAYCSLEGLRV